MTELLWSTGDTSALRRSCARSVILTISSHSASTGGVAAYIAIVELVGHLLFLTSSFYRLCVQYFIVHTCGLESKYFISSCRASVPFALVELLDCKLVTVFVSSQVRKSSSRSCSISFFMPSLFIAIENIQLAVSRSLKPLSGATGPAWFAHPRLILLATPSKFVTSFLASFQSTLPK